MLSLHEMFGRAGKRQDDIHILDEHEIVDGIDELGVLLYGHEKNAYWYGSQLSIEETRQLAPYQNATGLQVTSAVLAGMVWALENPTAGIVEADEMDFRRCLEVQMPYLGPVIGTVHRLDAAHRPAGPVPRGHRQARPLAVQERAGAVSVQSSIQAAPRQTAASPGYRGRSETQQRSECPWHRAAMSLRDRTIARRCAAHSHSVEHTPPRRPRSRTPAGCRPRSSQRR